MLVVIALYSCGTCCYVDYDNRIQYYNIKILIHFALKKIIQHINNGPTMMLCDLFLQYYSLQQYVYISTHSMYYSTILIYFNIPQRFMPVTFAICHFYLPKVVIIDGYDGAVQLCLMSSVLQTMSSVRCGCNHWSRITGPESLVQNHWSRITGPESLVQSVNVRFYLNITYSY